MVQTREERNEARSQARFERQHRRYKSLLNSLMELYQEAPRTGMSHEKILQRRSELMNSDAWKGLNGTWHYKLMGVCDTLFETLHRSLEWTHVLDGKRVRIRDFPPDRIRDIDTNQSAHCYVIDDKLIPWTEKDRVLESDRI